MLDHVAGLLIIYPCHGKALMLPLGIIQNGFSIINWYLEPLILRIQPFSLFDRISLSCKHCNVVWDNTGKQLSHRWETWHWSEVFYFVSLLWISLKQKVPCYLSPKLKVFCCWTFRGSLSWGSSCLFPDLLMYFHSIHQVPIFLLLFLTAMFDNDYFYYWCYCHYWY